MKILGLDVGGTKTSVCIGAESGEIFVANRMATRPGDGPDKCIDRMLDLCSATLEEAGTGVDGIAGVGIAAPGPISSSEGTLLAPPNMPGWDKVFLRDRIAEKLGCKVWFNNDANAGALAEYYFGEFKGTANLVYLTHSTGMGGGIISNGALVQGCTDTGGEVGHFVLNPEGPQCPCGLHGCFEVYCGGRSVALRLQEKIRAGRVKTAIVDAAGGVIEQIDFKAFLEAAGAGDEFAVSEWGRYVESLAHGIGVLVMTMNPDVIVLGTIAVNAGDFLMNPLRKKLLQYAWADPVNACKIAPSSLGGRVGDLGALAVAIHGLHGTDAR